MSTQTTKPGRKRKVKPGDNLKKWREQQKLLKSIKSQDEVDGKDEAEEESATTGKPTTSRAKKTKGVKSRKVEENNSDEVESKTTENPITSRGKRAKGAKSEEVERKNFEETVSEAIEKPTTSRAKRAKVQKTEKTETMSNEDWENAKSVYDFTVNTINGEPVSLEKYKGFVLLIVNVASRCGLTSTNYAQLVELDEKYRDKGLRILAFPCNQFAGQEPGDAEQICAYTKKKNVNFDIFEKIDVNGDKAHPLYKYLKKKQPGTLGDFIKWNFSKFIVDKEGQPVERHAPTAKPLSLIPNIEKYL